MGNSQFNFASDHTQSHVRVVIIAVLELNLMRRTYNYEGYNYVKQLISCMNSLIISDIEYS